MKQHMSIFQRNKQLQTKRRFISTFRPVIFLALFSITLNLAAQKNSVTMSMQNIALGEILQEIKLQSGRSILYNNDVVDVYKNESISIKNLTVLKALEECLKGKNLHYKIVDEVIIIEPVNAKTTTLQSQDFNTQTIKGWIVDLNTGSPLIGANIILLGSDPVRGTISDEEGYFRLEEVPVGRQSIEVSYVGYADMVLRNLYLISGKEYVVNIKLEEKVFQGEEIMVKAFSRKDLPLNEMAQVGARSFSVEETERYAGSVGDPSRMASGYAGVLTLGTQVNDIVIRGNSTSGLLWRMQGLRIPNPNHFGDMSSSGGTMSMLNNNVLGNSDFYTGAFPAEFGDAQSGIFDLRLRKGNQEKREYLAQIGFNGFEAGAEGPFKKENRASYIANYRYSTIGVFDLLGLEIGVFAIPVYQDMSFNIDMPTRNAGKFSFFGLGGLNRLYDEYYNVEENKADTTDFSSYVGFTGVNHLYFFNENSSISTSIGLSSAQNKTFIHVNVEDEIEDFSWVKNNESTIEFQIEYKNKLNSRNLLKFGADYYYADFTFRDSLYLPAYDLFTHTIDIAGDAQLIQMFGEWKHRFSNKLSFVGGLHSQYSKLGDDHSLEPRLSIKWDINQKHSVSLGGGLYSKMQPRFIYYKEELLDTVNNIYHRPNENLKMTRSKQVVVGYDYLFAKNHRLKLEGYYQYLDKVPVQEDSSYLSLINYGSSFSVYDYHALVNEGTGYNYGLELTLEKFLSKGFYYLFTLSLFESKYKGSDNILRHTRYSNNIMCNLLGGYEWSVGRNNTIGFDGKVSWARGERRIPLDYEASGIAGEAVYVISRAYEERFKDYFRLDYRFYFKINKRTSHTLSIDIMNVTFRQNHFLALYDKETNDYEEVSTLSIMPAFVWRWNF